MKNPPRHIAIDANEANVVNRVGSNVYAFALLSQLELDTRNNTSYRWTILLANPPVADLPAARAGWQYRVLAPRPFWTQWALPWHLFWHRRTYDLIFSAGHYAPRVSLVPSISCVMDLAFLHFPEQFLPKDAFQLREWTRYSVHQAQKVVAISDFTRQEVLSTYGKSPADVVVIPPAIAEEKVRWSEKERLSSLRKWQISNPFFLTVGTIQPRKNVIGIVVAFEQFRDAEKQQSKSKKGRRTSTSVREPMLVIAGKPGWLSEPTMQRIAASPYRESIVITGYISEQEKAILIHEATALIMYGFYEGFGIPALEALKYGTIPLVSETSSLPEVVGLAGKFVQPRKPESLAKVMSEILQLPAKERAHLLRKGREQEKKFRWSLAAVQLLNLMESVIVANRGEKPTTNPDKD